MKSNAKWYNFGLELSLLLTVLLVPLVFAPQLNVSFEFIKVPVFRSLVWVGMFFFVIKLVYERKISLPNLGKYKFLWYLIGGYFLAILLAALLSVAPELAFFGAYYRLQGAYTFLHYGLFFFMLVATIRDRGQLKKYIYVAILGAALAAAIGLLKHHFPLFLNYWDTDKFLGRAFLPLGHPNYLASYLIMIFPLTVGALITTAKKYRVFFVLALILFLVLMLLTLSRAATLGLFAAIVFFILSLAVIKKRKRILRATLATILVAVLTLFLVNIYGSNSFIRDNPVLSRIVLEGENMRSIESRLIMWPAVIEQALDRPILGYGPDTFGITFPAYAPAALLEVEDIGSFADRAHNEILDTLVSSGFVGLALYLALLITVFIIGFKQKDRFTAGVLAGIVALFIANQFGFSMVTHYMYLWFFIAIILINLPERTEYDFKFLKYDTSKAVAILLISALSTFTILAHNVQLVRADYFFKIAPFEKAANIYPHQSHYSYTTANIASLADNFEKAHTYLDLAGEYTGHDSYYYYYLGNIQAREGVDFNNSYEKAASLAPTNPHILRAWGAALNKAASYKKSIEILEKYLDLVPTCWAWKLDLAARSPEEQEKYRIFYKLNPNFDDVFDYLVDSCNQVGDFNKADYYRKFAK
ncbi:MAG: O-antigen ligase family protein [Patescibacteria group bacterium]|nr:O-antigen ligase family protein [Patescibacteria group bacterium]